MGHEVRDAEQVQGDVEAGEKPQPRRSLFTEDIRTRLAKHDPPTPQQIAKLIKFYTADPLWKRDTPAVFEMLQQSLGNGFVQQVLRELSR